MRKVKKKNMFEKLQEKIKDTIDEKKTKTSSRTRTTAKRKDSSVKAKDTSTKNKSTTSKNVPSKTTVKSKKVNSKEKKNKRSLWKRILTVILIIGIIGILLLTAFFGYIAISSPKFSESAFDVKDQTVVYDINGEIIATLGAQKRESVSYDKLPQVLIDAIIATEDSRFFQHNGVDLPRFIKATVLQLLGRDAGGASTLTMQTVKNNLTKKDSIETNKIQKIIRKFQDVYLAVFKVEKEYSKEEIIELYVNNYNLGANVYGVQEASKYYFGKDVSELTLPEASLIAGLFQAPNGHNPYKNMESAISRRNTVLDLMVRHGYITKDEATMAKKVTIESLLANNNTETEYQGFIDVVVKEVEELTGENPYTTPMKIHTTMEKSIQDGINSILSNNEWYWKNDELVQAGIAVVNVETGAISAVGNGRNRPNGVRIFNYATEAKKQPGSTAKPIFDYGPGIEYNNFSSYTLFNDEPWTYTDGPSVNNWDGNFDGLVTTRYALQYSRNVPALKAFQQVGAKNSQKFAYSLGLDVSLNQNSENYRIVNKTTGVDNTINEAYAIGGSAEGFSPLTMAAAYAGFASGGYYTSPYSVTKIEFRESGEVKEYKPTKTRVMKDSTAYIMNNILESAVSAGFHGGTRDAYNSGSHVAAKTGTSNYDEATIKKYNLPDAAVNDLWTVAYTSQYSIAVWYGYDSIYDKETDRVTYNVSYGGQKEGVVAAVMNYIPKDTKGWTMPSSVVSTQVERETWPAKLPSKYTPSDLITTEVFVRGSQPTEESERFSQLDNITSVNTTKKNNSVTITWNYTEPKTLSESYIKSYFNQSVYGNEKEKYISNRIQYNQNTLGEIGFGIYQKDSSGSLKLIDYVTENTYTYTGYGSTTLVIKAEHKNYKSNASSGYEIKVSLGDAPTGKLSATLDGKSTVNTNVGTYEEDGIKTITYTTTNDGTINVTNNATIKYQVKSDTNTSYKSFTNEQDLVTYINSLEAGKYEITYIITYLNAEVSKKRIVYLR